MGAEPSPVSRRAFLKTIGGSAALIAVGATGGLTWRAVDQGVFSAGQGPAYDAWRVWDNRAGGEALGLVRAAVLAASAHNSQPWLFRLSADSVELYADTARNIGTMDPLRREMYISLGCALENLLVAAEARGVAATLHLMPDPKDHTFVARVDLAPAPSKPSALYEAIPKRHTNRAAYAARAIPQKSLNTMRTLINTPDVDVVWYTSDAQKRAFSDLTLSATHAIIADREQAADDFAWYRGDWRQLQARKDGLTLDTSGVSPLTRAAGKLLGVSQTQSDQGWLTSTRETQLPTASAFGVVVVSQPANNAHRIEAGRAWQRMQLWATSRGLAMQPLNQIVERADRELASGLRGEFTDGIAAMMPDAGWHAVMPFRVGYPTMEALANPRRPAEEVLVRGSP